MTNSNSVLLTIISRSFQQYADRPAMVVGNDTYTYAQLSEAVSKAQDKIGDVRNQIIGVVAEDTLEAYASILAVLFSGNGFVVLHPRFPDVRNRALAAKAHIAQVLYGRQPGTWWTPDSGIRATCVAGTDASRPQPPVLVPGEAPAYIIFTSGSTGEPKGVPISRANLDAFYSAYGQLGWRLDCHDRMLQMFELTFDVSVVSFLYPLTLGACVCTVSPEGMKYLNVLDVMETRQVTFAAIAPSVLRLARPYFGELSLPSLRYLVVTAEATDVSLIDAFRPCIPQATVVNLYGPTEATIYCTAYTLPPGHARHHNGMAAIGKPFAGMKARVVDDQGRDVPADTEGELWMSGPQVMSGYWEDEVRTAQCFAMGPDGRKYYRTGDICLRAPDGCLLYCGRMDTQVKIQGFRVELGEIEFQVKTFYHHAHNAVVIACQDDNVNYELHLFVEGANADSLQPLERFLQKSLPPYMLPRQTHFLPAFPLNSNNKIDKKKLKQLI